MWNEETTQALEKAGKKAEDLEAKLKLGFGLHQDAKALENQAKDVKGSANIILEEVFRALGITEIKGEGLGSVNKIVDKTRVSYDIDKVKAYLIGHGVSATVAKNAANAGKKESKSSYIEFRAPRKKKGGK